MTAADPLQSLTGQAIVGHRPWSRLLVDTDTWSIASARLADGALTLIALWGEPDHIHMAVADAADPVQCCVLSLPCPGGQYPSVGRVHAPAIRLERTAADLFGLIPEGLPDARPWLDHGAWGVVAPLGRDPKDGRRDAEAYEFLPVDAENVHQVPVGPVHAGIIEPGHFRFTADGETVVRLEERFGYTHKGIEGLLQGADLDRAARLAGRCSGDSTVAYAWAFSSAVEAALGCTPPPRAIWLRALMAELERLANHLGDVGAVCNDAAFPIMLAHCSVLRERVLRQAMMSFGHRLMMDCILPGGVRTDLAPPAAQAIAAEIAKLWREFRRLVELYRKTASLQDRTVGTGVLQPTLARQYGTGGYVGRASGRQTDARRWPGYAPYADLAFDVPTLQEGDVDARVLIRIAEVSESIRLIEQILAKLPNGPIFATPVQSGTVCEGVAMVEGFRGDVFCSVRIEADGRIGRCHLRDPSWFQWPLLEAAIEGNIIADFPLINKSFNCSYSGSDL
jgi:Ni,Fe-hydrogenase III large subunit